MKFLYALLAVLLLGTPGVVFVVTQHNFSKGIPYFSIGVAVAVAVITMLAWWFIIIPELRLAEVRRNGVLAKAVVIKSSALGKYLTVWLKVQIPNQPPFRAKAHTKIMPFTPIPYKPGMVVRIKYNPKYPKLVDLVDLLFETTENHRNHSPNSGPVVQPVIPLPITNFIFEGKTYARLEDMPLKGRTACSTALGMMGKEEGLPEDPTSDFGSQKPSEAPLQTLKQLKKMLAQGLINSEDYAKKKREILSRM